MEQSVHRDSLRHGDGLRAHGVTSNRIDRGSCRSLEKHDAHKQNEHRFHQGNGDHYGFDRTYSQHDFPETLDDGAMGFR